MLNVAVAWRRTVLAPRTLRLRVLINDRAGPIRRAHYAQDLSRLKQPASETMGSHQVQAFWAKSHHSKLLLHADEPFIAQVSEYPGLNKKLIDPSYNLDNQVTAYRQTRREIRFRCHLLKLG